MAKATKSKKAKGKTKAKRKAG
ncbi:MAG: hypothetical protein QOD25_1766, partial [Alphaproteobacteria bacterium]|nr:hypothetical protein [Alphaproteobacteria bacterium]